MVSGRMQRRLKRGAARFAVSELEAIATDTKYMRADAKPAPEPEVPDEVEPIEPVIPDELDPPKPIRKLCKGSTVSGTPCQRNAKRSGFCKLHKPKGKDTDTTKEE